MDQLTKNILDSLKESAYGTQKNKYNNLLSFLNKKFFTYSKNETEILLKNMLNKKNNSLKEFSSQYFQKIQSKSLKILLAAVSSIAIEKIFNIYTGHSLSQHFLNSEQFSFLAVYITTYLGFNCFNKADNLENAHFFKKNTKSKPCWYVKLNDGKEKLLNDFEFKQLVNQAIEKNQKYSISFINSKKQLVSIKYEGKHIHSNQETPAVTITNKSEILKLFISNGILQNYDFIDRKVQKINYIIDKISLSDNEKVKDFLKISVGNIICNQKNIKQVIEEKSNLIDNIQNWFIDSIENNETWVTDLNDSGIPKKLDNIKTLEQLNKFATEYNHKYNNI